MQHTVLWYFVWNGASRQAEGRKLDAFPNLSCTQATEALTAAITDTVARPKWLKSHLEYDQSCVSLPVFLLLNCLNLDSNPFGNPPVQHGSTWKDITILKSALTPERKKCFITLASYQHLFPFQYSLIIITDHDRHVPHVPVLHVMSVISLPLYHVESKFGKYL